MAVAADVWLQLMDCAASTGVASSQRCLRMFHPYAAGELAQTGGIFARLVAAARSGGGHQH